MNAAAFKLTNALMRMVGRLGEAERRSARADARYLELLGTPQAAGYLAEYERQRRAAKRRYAAVQRLAIALAELAGTR